MKTKERLLQFKKEGLVINMKRWIIFDMMGVIFTVGDDTNDLLVPFVQKANCNITAEVINQFYKEASLGNITSKQFWKNVGLSTENILHNIEKEYLDSCLTLDPMFIEVATRLGERYNLAILSNDVSEWSSYLREKFQIDHLIKTAVISGDVHCRKPAMDIYTRTLESIDVSAKDCVFIDDRDKNLVPAMKLGMKVIRFFREDSTCAIENIMTVSSFRDLEENVERCWEM